MNGEVVNLAVTDSSLHSPSSPVPRSPVSAKPLPDCTIAIAGLGLMGGSLGLALRGKVARVVGIARRAETIAQALAIGAIDDGAADLSAAVRCRSDRPRDTGGRDPAPDRADRRAGRAGRPARTASSSSTWAAPRTAICDALARLPASDPAGRRASDVRQGDLRAGRGREHAVSRRTVRPLPAAAHGAAGHAARRRSGDCRRRLPIDARSAASRPAGSRHQPRALSGVGRSLRRCRRPGRRRSDGVATGGQRLSLHHPAGRQRSRDDGRHPAHQSRRRPANTSSACARNSTCWPAWLPATTAPRCKPSLPASRPAARRSSTSTDG